MRVVGRRQSSVGLASTCDKMGKFRIQSRIFNLDKTVELDGVESIEEAKKRYMDGVKDEIGPATARTMGAQITVKRIDDGNSETKQVE